MYHWSHFRSKFLEEQQRSHPRILDQARIHILFDFYALSAGLFLIPLLAFFTFPTFPISALIGFLLSLLSLILLQKRPFRHSLITFATGCFFLQFTTLPFFSTGLLVFLVASTIIVSTVLSFNFRHPWGPLYLWASFFSWALYSYHKTNISPDNYYWIFFTALLASMSMHLMNSLFRNIRLQETILKHALTRQKELNKEMESFTFSASHDLQEPLRKIISFSDLMNRQFKKDLDPKAQQYLYYMSDAAKRMKQLIHSLLEYSRTGRTPIRIEAIPLPKMLSEITRIRIPSKSQDSITIDVAETLFADPIQIERVFGNLVENAWKYQNPEKKFSLAIYSECKNEGIYIHFKDEGIGISPQFHKLVFELFQRLHPPEGIRGSGIGLSICKKIIEMHKGSIHLQSNPGEGSTFTIWLPQKKSNTV